MSAFEGRVAGQILLASVLSMGNKRPKANVTFGRLAARNTSLVLDFEFLTREKHEMRDGFSEVPLRRSE